MEPPPKRQRAYAPAHGDFNQSFSAQHEYYDDTADNQMMDVFEEEVEAEAEEDPDAQLEQRRARLDYKLKSTFEAIFEKYGKDFDGVGDEIDLRTGKILVDNGHLMKMQSERDAGDFSKAQRALRDFTAEPDNLTASSIDDTEMLDDDEEDEDLVEDEEEDDEDDIESTSDDGMIDDSMILRGFAKANRFIQKPATVEVPKRPQPPAPEPRREKNRRSSTGTYLLPSHSDILLQFGPQLGPHIAQFVLQQQEMPESPIPDDSHIESAWRVPRIPHPKPLKRPVKRPVVMAPEPERPPSPGVANSMWAQDRRIIKPAQAPPRYYESLQIDPLSESTNFGYIGTPQPVSRQMASLGFGYSGTSKPASRKSLPMNHGYDRMLKHASRKSLPTSLGYDETPKPTPRQPVPMSFDAHETPGMTSRKIRKNFTREDDQILLKFVEQARRQNLELGSLKTWARLEEMHPNHSSVIWKKRYETEFTYLRTDEGTEPESSETSIDAVYKEDRSSLFVARSFDQPSIPARPPFYDRPSRVRKPAVKDPQIFSWSQAVQAIESVDPDMHAGILEDSRSNQMRDARRSVSSSFGEDLDYAQRNPEALFRREHLPPSRRRNDSLPNSRRIGESSSGFRPSQSRFSCAQCSEGFKHKSDLDNHGSSTRHAAYVCVYPECEFQSPLSSDILRHQSLHQNVLSRFPCIHCQEYSGSRGFKQEDDLHQHILKSHPKVNLRIACSQGTCRGIHSKVYNLRRQDEEELSEMCLHLFNQHQITPYPCNELNCSRQSVEGFFTQMDLVRHIRFSHPNTSALDRLRGRVDSKYIELTGLSDTNNLVAHHETIEQSVAPSTTRESVPGPLSYPKSSTSLGDRTITPRMMTETDIGAAQSTPTTSISSLVVHPASGTTAPPVRSRERLNLSRDDDTFENRAALDTQPNSPVIFGTPLEVLGMQQLSDPFRSDSIQQSLPTPQASLNRSVGPSAVLAGKPDTMTPEAHSERHIRTRSRTRVPMRTIIPNSQSFSDSLALSSFDIPDTAKLSKPAEIPTSLLRPIDKSYAFSDEGDEESMALAMVALEPATVEEMLPERRLTRPVVEIPLKSMRELTGQVESHAIAINAVQELPSSPPATAVKTARPSAVATKTVVPPSRVTIPKAVVSKATASETAVSRAVQSIADEHGVSMPLFDEPIVMKPTMAKRRASQPSIVKPIVEQNMLSKGNKHEPTLPPTTPASRIPFQRRKSIALNADENDFDELSSEQFGMFAHPRTNPQPKTNPILARVKHAGNNKSPLVHSAPSRKRKLNVFKESEITAKPAAILSTPAVVASSNTAGPSSVSKLPVAAVISEVAPSTASKGKATTKISKVPTKAPFPIQTTPLIPESSTSALHSAQEDPAIKDEEPESISLPTLAPALPVTTKRSRRLRKISPRGPSPFKSPFGRQIMSIRPLSKTPLLDLTPSRRSEKRGRGMEIRDSDEDSSPLAGVSRFVMGNAGVGGERNGEGKNSGSRPRTPVMMDRVWDRAAIVLRTPGGTFRKCGEDGFRCGKGFCFACGVVGGLEKGKGKERA